MIRCVLFDLDGTLVDTWDLYVEAYTRALEPHVGRRLTLEELIALRPNSELRLLQRGAAGSDVGLVHREFLRHYRALHRTHFGGPYPGVREMLAVLRSSGMRLGIVTGKSHGAWEITAEASDLGAFEVVVTDEDTKEAKPDPEGLVLALDRLGVQASEAIYVGDSVGDAQAARAADLRFGVALWPKAPHERDAFLAQVRAVGVWAELSVPKDLVAILQRP